MGMAPLGRVVRTRGGDAQVLGWCPDSGSCHIVATTFLHPEHPLSAAPEIPATPKGPEAVNCSP